MKVYYCKHIDKGFIDAKKSKGGYTFYTDNIKDARMYKTRQGAARAFNFRSPDSEVGKLKLHFIEAEYYQQIEVKGE